MFSWLENEKKNRERERVEEARKRDKVSGEKESPKRDRNEGVSKKAKWNREGKRERLQK